jgi:FhaA, N-terminal domain/FHA domain
MASIADIEQLLEQVFERSTTRLFRTRVQPVQLEHRVERAMERARVSRRSRTEVPSRYRVRVNPSDLEDLAPDPSAAQALASRLADAALVFARSHAYHLSRRPRIAVVADPVLPRGQVAVDADEPAIGAVHRSRPESRDLPPSAPGQQIPPAMVTQNDQAAPSPGRGRSVHGNDIEVSDDPLGGGGSEPAAALAEPPVPDGQVQPPSQDAEPFDVPVQEAPREEWDDVPDAPDAPPASDPVPTPAGGPGGEPLAIGIRGDGSQTHVFRRPSPEAARAVLRMIDPGGHESSVEVDGRPLTIGRARDNGLVVGDARVSRHHGRLLARHGVLVYADLESTNGSRVNGVRVDEIALGVGDRILVGDTVLVVELLPG